MQGSQSCSVWSMHLGMGPGDPSPWSCTPLVCQSILGRCKTPPNHLCLRICARTLKVSRAPDATQSHNKLFCSARHLLFTWLNGTVGVRDKKNDKRSGLLVFFAANDCILQLSSCTPPGAKSLMWGACTVLQKLLFDCQSTLEATRL